MMQLGVAIALLLAIGLPVVRADDGEECMGDVVYCFMVVIYAAAFGIPIIVWTVRKTIQFREQRRARIEAAMHADILPM